MKPRFSITIDGSAFSADTLDQVVFVLSDNMMINKLAVARDLFLRGYARQVNGMCEGVVIDHDFLTTPRVLFSAQRGKWHGLLGWSTSQEKAKKFSSGEEEEYHSVIAHQGLDVIAIEVDSLRTASFVELCRELAAEVCEWESGAAIAEFASDNTAANCHYLGDSVFELDGKIAALEDIKSEILSQLALTSSEDLALYFNLSTEKKATYNKETGYFYVSTNKQRDLCNVFSEQLAELHCPPSLYDEI